MFQYKTHGTCSQQILIDVNDDDVIENVQFIGGCTGNTQGVSKLVKGMKVDEVIARLKGIQCRAGTSCRMTISMTPERFFEFFPVRSLTNRFLHDKITHDFERRSVSKSFQSNLPWTAHRG